MHVCVFKMRQVALHQHDQNLRQTAVGLLGIPPLLVRKIKMSKSISVHWYFQVIYTNAHALVVSFICFVFLNPEHALNQLDFIQDAYQRQQTRYSLNNKFIIIIAIRQDPHAANHQPRSSCTQYAR